MYNYKTQFEKTLLLCKHGIPYPNDGLRGPWNCNPDGSNPNCNYCEPDAWIENHHKIH